MDSQPTCGGLKIVLLAHSAARNNWRLTALLDQLRASSVFCEDIYEAAGEVIACKSAIPAVVVNPDSCSNEVLRFLEWCKKRDVEVLAFMPDVNTNVKLDRIRKLMQIQVKLCSDLKELQQELYSANSRGAGSELEGQAEKQPLKIEFARPNLLSQDELDALLGMG